VVAASGKVSKAWFVDGGGWRERKCTGEEKFDPIVDEN